MEKIGVRLWHSLEEFIAAGISSEPSEALSALTASSGHYVNSSPSCGSVSSHSNIFYASVLHQPINMHTYVDTHIYL